MHAAFWVIARVASREGFVIDVIDPAGRAATASGAKGGDNGSTTLSERVDAADGFIVVSPEYNHSYPAALKTLIDGCKREWYAKPVAFVSYGGASGGVRAVEHLRGVFTELHAVGIRDAVSFPNIWDAFDAEGTPRNRGRADQAAATMLARFRWWAEALRDARHASDYAEAAA